MGRRGDQLTTQGAASVSGACRLRMWPAIFATVAAAHLSPAASQTSDTARAASTRTAQLTAAEFPELAWLAAGTDRVDFLSRVAAPCGAEGRGRVLFESSALLGGTAARFGLSCASCHRGGRNNPHFFITGISDKPGTADVTDALFGPGRANGVADARAIPDLAASTGLRFADRRDPDFRAFVRQLIVDEFGGKSPSDSAMDDLIEYLVQITPRCIGEDAQLTLSRDFDLTMGGLDAARWHLARGNADSAALYLRAARRQLDLVDRRFAPPAQAIAGRGRPTLRKTARALAHAQRDLAAIDSAAGDIRDPQLLASVDASVAKATATLRARAARLAQAEGDSLYDRGVIAQALRSDALPR